MDPTLRKDKKNRKITQDCSTVWDVITKYCHTHTSYINKTQMLVIAALPSAGAKGNSGHFQSSEQHADGTKLLVRYDCDFLAVFHRHLTCRFNSNVRSSESMPMVPQLKILYADLI